jgi:peptide/nickel transport system permease protein
MAWRLPARHLGGTLSAGWLAVLLGCALLGAAVAPHDPLAVDAARSLQPPSAAHPFGTDQQGRDLLSRCIVAARLDLAIAFGAVLLSAAIGVPLGAAAGFAGGWTDRVVGRLLDTLMAFPLFVLAMGVVAVMGNTVANIVYATALVNIPFYARMARAETALLAQSSFVEAARTHGHGAASLLLRVIAPNLLPVLIVQITLNLSWAILNAAGLSFLGLGVRPPTPEWGIMVAEGAGLVVSGEWWVALFPGLVLVSAVIAFNFLGDALRDIADPRRR